MVFVDPVDRRKVTEHEIEWPREESHFQGPGVRLSEFLTHMTLPFLTVPSQNLKQLWEIKKPDFRKVNKSFLN